MTDDKRLAMIRAKCEALKERYKKLYSLPRERFEAVFGRAIESKGREVYIDLSHVHWGGWGVAIMRIGDNYATILDPSLYWATIDKGMTSFRVTSSTLYGCAITFGNDKPFRLDRQHIDTARSGRPIIYGSRRATEAIAKAVDVELEDGDVVYLAAIGSDRNKRKDTGTFRLQKRDGGY